MNRPLLISAFTIISAAAAFAQSVIPNNPGTKPTVAIRNATIHPVTAPDIANGTIILSGGRIIAIGADVVVPQGAAVIDASGLHVYPGMIDSGTNIGLTEISSVAGTNDLQELGDLNPNARAALAINPHSNLIPVTRITGITTVVTSPEGGLISGQDALIQLAGWTPQEMVLKAPLGVRINFPRVTSGFSTAQPQDEEVEKEAKKNYTNQLDKLRDTFRDAKAYAKALRARERDGTLPRLEPDLILEHLVGVVEGRIPLIVTAYVESDIRAAIKFAEEIGVRMILAGGDDVQRVIPELQRSKTAVILGSIWSLPPREDDPYDLLFSNPAALHRAGIPFAIQSLESHNSRNLPYQVANCVAYGLPKEEALRAITINPARIFGVADQIGSLEVGKLANVIVTDGDPLEVRTNVRHLFIGGEPISLDSYQTLLYEKFRKRPVSGRQ